MKSNDTLRLGRRWTVMKMEPARPEPSCGTTEASAAVFWVPTRTWKDWECLKTLIGWFLEKNCKCRIRQHETNIQQFHLNVQFRNLYTHFSSLSILILVCLGGPYYRQSEILSFSFWYYRNMFPYLLDRNLGYRSVLTRNLQ